MKDMELINLEGKRIMERCKKRALDAGLTLPGKGNTLEYIISNRKLNELRAKVMVPTLYDFWMHDVETIRTQTIYDYYPHNPYETVINTHPPISFYNDNNAGWVNTFIDYHVLAHIDFFWNNIYFSDTHADDFCGKALSDKRKIAKLREGMGGKKIFVDYVIEFTRSIDNLFSPKKKINKTVVDLFSDTEELDFYFGLFTNNLKKEKRITMNDYLAQIKKLNELTEKYGEKEGTEIFFMEIAKYFPEFNETFKKYKENESEKVPKDDVLHYLTANSEFINHKNKKNVWMKDVASVVKATSAMFYPQIITKILNEGWASYWHQELFMNDEKMIDGHRSEFSVMDAHVTSVPRVGINPYAIGQRLIRFVKKMGDDGKFSNEFQMNKNMKERYAFDSCAGKGKEMIFKLRRLLDDRQFINFLSNDDFEDFVRQYNLYVVGTRLKDSHPRPKVEYYVKSRSGKEYRKMLNRSLYIPPHVWVNEEKAKKEKGELYLEHDYEGRSLVTRHIHDVLLGIAYMWGEGMKPVSLETTEFEMNEDFQYKQMWQSHFTDEEEMVEQKVKFKKIRRKYTMLKGKMDVKDLFFKEHEKVVE